jgi:hypothetical protein
MVFDQKKLSIKFFSIKSIFDEMTLVVIYIRWNGIRCFLFDLLDSIDLFSIFWIQSICFRSCGMEPPNSIWKTQFSGYAK